MKIHLELIAEYSNYSALFIQTKQLEQPKPPHLQKTQAHEKMSSE